MSCRKRGYKTRHEARVALGVLRAKRHGRRIESYVYQCGLCGFWHLSSGRPKR